MSKMGRKGGETGFKSVKNESEMQKVAKLGSKWLKHAGKSGDRDYKWQKLE